MSTPLPQQPSRDRIRARQARLAEAASLAAGGEVEAAARIVESVLVEDPQYGPARVLLERLTASPPAAAGMAPQLQPRPMSDSRPPTPAPSATLPGTNVSVGSWAQFQRRMQLRRETTCVGALRRAMDARDYRTALDRANELVAIDPGWGEVKGFLEDLVANASRPPAEGPKAPLSEPPDRTQVSDPAPLPASAQVAATTAPSVAAPETATTVSSATVAVAGSLENRSARRRWLVPVAVALVLALATVAGWGAARLLPLNALAGPRVAQQAPAPVVQAPAGGTNPTADSPPLPLVGVVPPLPIPAADADASANENGVSQNRNAAVDTPADPTGSAGQSSGGTTARQLNGEPPDGASSSAVKDTAASAAKAPATKSSTALPERPTATSGTSTEADAARARAVPPAVQSGTRDSTADVMRPPTTAVAQNSDTTNASASNTSAPLTSTPTTPTQPRYEPVSPSAAPPASSPSSSAAPPVSPPPTSAATDSRSTPPAATETSRETAAPTTAAGSTEEARATTGATEAAERERDREREATEERAINRTLDAYANAYSALNATAVRHVWPAVNEEALRTAFGQLESQRVAFSDCTIDIRGLHAAATCMGSATYVPKVGNSRQLSVSHRWQFALRKVVDTWLIDAATIK